MLGPSGSGKTTLIRAIVGVQIVAGRRRRPCSASPPAHRTLRDRARLRDPGALRLWRPDRAREPHTTSPASSVSPSDRVGRGDRAPSTLGEHGRAARRAPLGRPARARLARDARCSDEPDLLVLDEPTVGLDPVLRRDLWKLVPRACRRRPTLLVSSHVMDEADRCDALLLLRDGDASSRDGTPAELRARTGRAGPRGRRSSALVRGGGAA